MYIAVMESAEAESAISVSIGWCSKTRKGKSGGNIRIEHQKLPDVSMELPTKQDVILTEIGSKILEEEENVDDIIAAQDNRTDYYLDFRIRNGSEFQFWPEECTDWSFKEICGNFKKIFNWMTIDLIKFCSGIWEILSSNGVRS